MSVTIYNPANKRKEQLVEEFIIRKKEFETVFNDINTFKEDYPPQHYLILGQRGSGKTTLIHRLKYAIEDELNLTKTYISIAFDEEQYGISELTNVWEKLAETLEDYHGFDGIVFKMQEHVHDVRFEEKCFQILTQFLRDKKKKIILFIDNFGDILKKFDDREVKRMREILMTSPDIRLIAASPMMIDQILDYQSPLFEFFKTVNLKGLTKNETKKLLIKLSELSNSVDKMKSIVNDTPERIEVLRLLTGGVTRTIVLLYNIFIDNVNGNSIRDLQLTLDTLTPLYKHKMDDLPKNQQKIIDIVAKSWDATSVKEIVSKTRIESKIVSAQLRQLEKNQLIQKIQTGKKNHLYQIKERFFNIWYLMRYGRKYDRSRVLWLVRFLESWCSIEELENRIITHINALQEGDYEHDAALLLGEAYISCNSVSFDLKEKLIDNIKSTFPKENFEELSIDNSELLKKAISFYESDNYSEAISIATQITDKKDGVLHFLMVNNFLERNFNESLKFAEKLLKVSDDENIHYTLGISYLEIGDFENAKKHLQISIDKGNRLALVDMGVMLLGNNKIREAEAFLKKGLKYKDTKTGAAHFLGHLYQESNEVKKAERNFKTAIKNGDERGNLCLAKLFHKENSIELAKEFYLKSIDLGIDEAQIGLGLLLIKNNELKEGKSYLAKISKSKNKYILFKLAEVYYYELDDYEKAKTYYEKALKLGKIEAAHKLGHVYARLDNFEKAEQHFLMYIEKTKDYVVLTCLSELYLYFRKEKEKALNTVTKAKRNIELTSDDYLVGAEIYLWNEMLEESIEYFEKAMEDTGFAEDRENTSTLINYFIELIGKKHFNSALKLLNEQNLKELLKPIYYVLMHYMKKDFPDEYLKMGGEIKDVVEEIIKEIDNIE